MSPARALVLAAPPVDERPWSNVRTEPMALVPVATRPIVFHTLDALRAAGVTETLLVADAEATPKFENAVGDGSAWGMQVSYAPARSGSDVVGAMDAAKHFVNGEPLVVHHADALLTDGLTDDVAGFASGGLDALELVVPRSTTLDLPDGGPGQAGCWLFSPKAVSTLLSGPRAGDPLLGLRHHGAQVQTREVDGCLACHGGEASLLRGNRHALERLRADYAPERLDECEIQGPVVIHPTAQVSRSLVRGPAIIGPGARVTDTYIGPYTSIGAGAVLDNTEIEHSIVMDDAVLQNVGTRLETSIIGRGASIVRRFDMPRAVRLSIGDGAEVALS